MMFNTYQILTTFHLLSSPLHWWGRRILTSKKANIHVCCLWLCIIVVCETPIWISNNSKYNNRLKWKVSYRVFNIRLYNNWRRHCIWLYVTPSMNKNSGVSPQAWTKMVEHHVCFLCPSICELEDYTQVDWYNARCGPKRLHSNVHWQIAFNFQLGIIPKLKGEVHTGQSTPIST